MSDRDVRGMARGSALSLALSVCAQACTMGVTLVLARQLGAADVGRYAQVQALLALLGIITLGGLRAGLTRFVATQRADGDLGAVHGTVRAGIAFAGVTSIVAGAALIVYAHPIAAGAFHDEKLTELLRLVGVTLPFASLTDVAISASQGFRRMRVYAVVQLFIEPTIRISLTALAIMLGAGVRGAVYSLLASNVIAAGLALTALMRLLGPCRSRVRYAIRDLMSFSFISWFATLATTGLIWADTVLLGILAKSSAVGVYNVATRLVMLAAFVMTPINQTVGPRIAHVSQLHDVAGLQRMYRVATGWIVRLSLPAFIILLAFPRELLRLFGASFAIGATVTVVFALGKLVDAATGPCSVMLNMTGRPAVNMAANLFALVLNVGLNLLLIPRYGVVGAAIAWTVSLVVVNAIRVVAVYALLGVLPFDAATCRSIVAAVGALGVAHSLRGVAGLGLAALLALALYVASVGLDLTPDDRLTIDSFRRRRTASTRDDTRREVAPSLSLGAVAQAPPGAAPVPGVLRKPVEGGCGALRAHEAHVFSVRGRRSFCPGIESQPSWRSEPATG